MTIEEMAEEFEVMVASSIMCETKERKSKLPTMHDAFIYGANAVLREIEDIVYRRYSEDSDGTERNKDLINRIKHLKGI